MKRILFSALTLIASVGFIGCASSSNTTAATKKAWSTDDYVPAEGDSGTQANASRILQSPEKVCDRVMLVGSKQVFVHKNPTATSPVVGALVFNDAVRVVAEGQFCRKTITSDMDEFADKGEMTPTWVKITSKSVSGWVPARSLFDAEKLALSSVSVADMREASDSSGKGFTRKVKSNLGAMKGAAGTPVQKGANYDEADRIIIAVQPLPYSTLSVDPFAQSTSTNTSENLGQPLSTLDPTLAAKASAATLSEVDPPTIAKTMDKAKGMMDMVGIKVDKQTEDNAKMAAAVLNLVMQMTEESSLTPVEEAILGRECLAACIGDDKVLPNTDPVSAYVNWVGTKIAANSSLPYPSIGYTFLVVKDDKTMNAMAMPGGPIIITTGMLNFLESESELASILAHEIAHVEERHGLIAAENAGAKKLQKLLDFANMESSGQLNKFLTDALSSSLSDVPESVRNLAVEQIVAQLKEILNKVYAEVTAAMLESINQGSSQASECAADLRGMSLARAAGWNPSALQSVLERLKQIKGDYGGANYSEMRSAEAGEVVVFLPKMSSESPDLVSRWMKFDDYLK